MKVLLLNATYEPLGALSPRRAVQLVLDGKAESVTDGAQVMRSPSVAVPVPSVARLVSMVKVPRVLVPRFSRRSLTVRDRGVCQVAGCGRKGDSVDHLVPQSRGGDTSWANCVLMCRAHNVAKGNRTLAEAGWALKATPRVPTAASLLAGLVPAEVGAAWTPWLDRAAGTDL